MKLSCNNLTYATRPIPYTELVDNIKQPRMQNSFVVHNAEGGTLPKRFE